MKSLSSLHGSLLVEFLRRSSRLPERIRVLSGKNSLLLALALLAGGVFSSILLLDGLSRFHGRTQDGRYLGTSSLEGFRTARCVLNLSFIALLAVYTLWLVRSPEERSEWRSLLARSLPFLVLAFVAYPASVDSYLYLYYGTMGLRGLNPYLVPAGSAPIALPIIWKETSTYGPLSQVVFMISALPAAFSPVAGIYVYKLFCLAAHVLNGFLVWRLLEPSSLRSKVTHAYLVNPSLLSMQVAEAHVDVFMCSWILLAAGSLLSRRYPRAVLAIWGGALTKTLPILWLPLVAGFLVARRRWKDLGRAGLVSAAIVALLAVTVLPGWSAWRSLCNPASAGRYARSTHHALSLVVQRLSTLSFQEQTAMLSTWAKISTGGFLLFYGWVFLQPHLKRRYSESHLASDFVWVTLALLGVATPWMMPWYATDVLPLGAVLVFDPLVGFCSLVFNLGCGIIYADGGGKTPISLLTSLSTIGPMIGVLVWRRRCSRVVARWATGPRESGTLTPAPPLRPCSEPLG